MKKRLLIALLFGLSHSLWAEPAVVDTPQGKLQGEVSEDGVRSFKAIPYALPPTGERRWKPAEPAENLLPGVWEFYEKLNASLRGG